MFKIQILNKISKIGLDVFDKGNYDISENQTAPDAVIVRSASMLETELGANTKAVVRAGAGTNNIPSDKYAAQGIVVFNTPGANANAVKEMVLLGLLISSRKVADAIDWAKTLKGKGGEVPKLVEKGKSNFTGPEVYGKKLGVIGLGAIGVPVANAAVSLGMEVYGYDPGISIKKAWRLSPSVQSIKDKQKLYEECDYITLHLPFTNDSKEMINSKILASMKDGARVLNFSRGELVNNKDMIKALKDKKISAYVVDFPTDELIGVPGVIAIPHLGASTPESEDNCAVMGAEQLIDFLENGNITNSVNFPNASMNRNGGTRVCVIHKNIAAMVSQITTVFSAAGINIEDMLNKSRGEYAYTMLDIAGELAPALIPEIEKIENVINVRVV
ncbi:MAG: phosphoglycerate dehydrogenase [Oscillospiraceae bacterium]|nr:phosphoglycerate dehydrogenase [Oscillospiraceae bacterium]